MHSALVKGSLNRNKQPSEPLTSARKNDMLFCTVLLLPAVLLCVTFIIIPIVDSVAMSVTEYKIANLNGSKPAMWNQFANYIRLFRSGKLLSAAVLTVEFVAVTVALT